jgi:hypothetical protein
MKLFWEILLSIVLHPVAFVLTWVHILGRKDLTTGEKILWMIVCFIWGIGPILYILVGNGQLW